MLQELGLDCSLNAADNDGVQCFIIKDGRPDQYLFDPNLEVDKIFTSFEYKEDTSEEPVPDIATGATAATAVKKDVRAPSQKEQIRVIQYKGIQYLLHFKKGSGNLIYHLYDRDDTTFEKPLGEIGIDPVTQQLTRKPTIY